MRGAAKPFGTEPPATRKADWVIRTVRPAFETQSPGVPADHKLGPGLPAAPAASA
jgi:hypothetical protein